MDPDGILKDSNSVERTAKTKISANKRERRFSFHVLRTAGDNGCVFSIGALRGTTAVSNGLAFF